MDNVTNHLSEKMRVHAVFFMRNNGFDTIHTIGRYVYLDKRVFTSAERARRHLYSTVNTHDYKQFDRLLNKAIEGAEYERADLLELINAGPPIIKSILAHHRVLLDVLIADSSEFIRADVARANYGLEILKGDNSPYVREVVRRITDKASPQNTEEGVEQSKLRALEYFTPQQTKLCL